MVLDSTLEVYVKGKYIEGQLEKAAYSLENADVRSVRTFKSKSISNRQGRVNWSCKPRDILGAGKPKDPEGCKEQTRQ